MLMCVCLQAVGPSMIPALNDKGDIVIYERLTYRLRGFERGEVVIAVSPENSQLRVCKRIIATVSAAGHTQTRTVMCSCLAIGCRRATR